VSEAIRTHWLPYERATLALLYLAPLAIWAGMPNGIPLAPVVLTMLALLVSRRTLRIPSIKTRSPIEVPPAHPRSGET
jgi:hypothetical protein